MGRHADWCSNAVFRAHRKHFGTGSVTRGQGKTYMLCSLHTAVFKGTKPIVHMFLILSFCCNHFCVYYWESSKKKGGRCIVRDCHLLLGCHFYPPFHPIVILTFLSSTWFTCSFHILQFRLGSGIKKNFSSISWSRILVQFSCSRQLVLFLVAFIVKSYC